MKKLYTLIVAMAIVALSANAQTPRLKPFKSQPVATSFDETMISTRPVTDKAGVKKAPYRATAVSTKALDYCNGTFDEGLGLGDLSYGDSLQAAISFTKTQLKEYAGKKIVALNVPITSESVSGLTAVYGWVAVGKRGNIVAMKALPTIKSGYVELTLDEPIEIDTTKTIYFGASYVLSSSAKSDELYCLACNSTVSKTKGGFYIGYGQKTSQNLTWSDLYAKGYGVYAIQGIVDGVERNMNDVTVLDFTTMATNTLLTDTIPAYIDLKNNGINEISSLDVDIYVNGKKTTTLTAKPSESIQTDMSSQVDLNIPISLTSVKEGAKLGITVSKINGSYDDDNKDDNSAEATFNAYAKLFQHNVLVEEGTGQWCGYCPQGVVAMDAMHEKNLDDFVGVAIHYGYLGDRNSVEVDSMAFAVRTDGTEYCNVLGISSFPVALYDRQYSASAYYAETIYKSLRQNQSPASIYGRAYWDGNNVVISGDVHFGLTADDGSKYRIQTYLIEDGVGPYEQHNYYAGSSYDMGGFENKAEWTPVVYNDVLRGVYPAIPSDYTLGEQLTDGKIYTWKLYQFEYTYEISDEVNRVYVKGNKGYLESGARYSNKDNLRLVLVLLDSSNNNAVVNCCKVAIAADEASAIKGVKQNDDAPVEYYSINGTRLAQPATKGVYIEKQGTKVTKKIAR